MNRRQAKKKYKKMYGYNPAKTLIRLFKKTIRKEKDSRKTRRSSKNAEKQQTKRYADKNIKKLVGVRSSFCLSYIYHKIYIQLLYWSCIRRCEMFVLIFISFIALTCCCYLVLASGSETTEEEDEEQIEYLRKWERERRKKK